MKLDKPGMHTRRFAWRCDKQADRQVICGFTTAIDRGCIHSDIKLCSSVIIKHADGMNLRHDCRYDAQCTLAKSNPGIALAPAPNSQFIITNLQPTTVPDMSTLSSPKPSSPGTVSAFSSKD